MREVAFIGGTTSTPFRPRPLPTVKDVHDNRDEIRAFLASRRARITPEQAGLAPGVRRRVPGPRPVTGPTQPPNIARFQFLDPAGPDFFPDWDTSADITVALLRTEAGRDPFDKGLTDLIGELCTRSADFRTRWAQHNVRLHHSGAKTFHHPAVGGLTLDYESMDLQADPGLNLTVYTAAPDTPSHDALRLLASWAATLVGDTDQPQDTSLPPSRRG